MHAGPVVAKFAERLTAIFCVFRVTRVASALVRRCAGTVSAVKVANRFTGERSLVTHRFITLFAFAAVWCNADPIYTARFRAYRFANVRTVPR